MKFKRNCDACGDEYIAERQSSRFCGPRCRYDWHQAGSRRERIPDTLRFQILRRDGFRCATCGSGPHTGHDLRVDHVTPVAEGGLLKDPENLIALCQRCNSGKGTTEIEMPATVLDTIVMVLEVLGIDPRDTWEEVEDAWALLVDTEPTEVLDES